MSMTSVEKVAQRFSHRPGCRFVGAKKWALRCLSWTCDVIVVEPRDVPPIDEFLLRALRLSIERPGDLASFLGLDLGR